VLHASLPSDTPKIPLQEPYLPAFDDLASPTKDLVSHPNDWACSFTIVTIRRQLNMSVGVTH
jgi:hypothetical protein